MYRQMFLKYTRLILTCLVLLCFAGKVYSQELTSDEYFTLAKKQANEKQDFAKATTYCEKALKLAPKDIDIKEYLGKCYMETGQLDKARETLLDVLKASPKRTDARHYLINIDTQQKRYASAICYVNELLEMTPYNKTLWMRKIALYDLMGNRIEASRETRRLYQIFPIDKEVQKMYVNSLKEDALKTTKGSNLSGAANEYEEALKVNDKDVELYLNLINLQIKAGRYQDALATANRGLNVLPDNDELLKKKVGILEETQEYRKAIDLVQAQLKKSNSVYYQDMLKYLTSEAARFYKNSDPYELYGQVYDRDKSNKEAQDYLLNTSISRGYYADAQEYLTRALKSNPNSKELLSKQLFVYEAMQNRQGMRSTIEKLYKQYPQDADIRDKYDRVVFEEAKIDFSQQNYSAALPVFARLTQNPEYSKSANNYLYSVYLAQKSYAKAQDQIEKMIRAYPGEQEYILKKIDLLANMQDYESAYEMARTYNQQYPENQEYRFMLNDIAIDYIKFLNDKEDYATVKDVTDELIAADPKNTLAYNYGIGARISMSQYDEAMELIQQALVYSPDSKELRLKEAGVYSQSGQHDKAVAALQQLTSEYPYNSSLKSSLIEEMLLYAKQKEGNDDAFGAKDIYNEVLLLKPNDTTAATKLANIHIARKEYAEAMAVVDKSLQYNKDNQGLLYLKGIIYEEMGDYKNAKEFQSKFNPPAYKVAEHEEHMDYLDSRMLKNQVILSYLNVNSDSLYVNTSVASLEYMRLNKNNTYVGRINYAARSTGVGVQGEIDWYHTFSNKSNFLASAGVSGNYFPQYKLSGSFYQPFKKTWQGELGIRYAKLQDDTNLLTGILGIEKTMSNVWLNARVFVISDGDEIYNSILAQGRFYMRNEKDYLMAMASVGNAPEDQRLDFQLDSFISYVNTMVGAGYFHYTSNRTSLGLVANWYNYKISSDFYLNQYNLFLTLRTKF